jgi:MoxR-like ATPase
MSVETAAAVCSRITQNVERVIIGKRAVVERALVCLLCGGHVLVEDVPGVGKTMLARSLAASVGGRFQRLQFTPDLLPTDVTGVSVYNQRSQEFEFRAGPVFANILLADEINRASPRTQSALLEAMEERQVTQDGVTHPLPDPFMVIATENPLEYEGVYPLPESQLDRFLMRLRLGYPER